MTNCLQISWLSKVYLKFKAIRCFIFWSFLLFKKGSDHLLADFIKYCKIGELVAILTVFDSRCPPPNNWALFFHIGTLWDNVRSKLKLRVKGDIYWGNNIYQIWIRCGHFPADRVSSVLSCTFLLMGLQPSNMTPWLGNRAPKTVVRSKATLAAYCF